MFKEKHMGGFHKWGYTHSWMVYLRENPVEMDDLGVPPFQEPPIENSWKVMLKTSHWDWSSLPPKRRVPSPRSCFPHLQPILLGGGGSTIPAETEKKGHETEKIWDHSPTPCAPVRLVMVGLYPCCWLLLQVWCMLFPVGKSPMPFHIFHLAYLIAAPWKARTGRSKHRATC